MGSPPRERPSGSRVLRLCRFFLRAASVLVPSEHRREWREEWDVELACRRQVKSTEGSWGPWAGFLLFAEAGGALADAFWHFSQEWSLDMLMQDLRYGLRALVKKPAFTTVAALTLALAIGSTTAIFSIVDTVLLRPLPYPQPERLVEIWEQNPVKGWYKNIVAPANFLDWQSQATTFEGLAAMMWAPDQLSLSGAGEPQPIKVQEVTGSFFEVLGVAPLHGRGFLPEDTWSGTEPSVVISYGLFHRQFGGDPSIVGRTVQVNQHPCTVVGVMPAGFSYPDAGIDAWSPTGWDPADREQVWFRRAHFLRVLGRLAPGVTAAEARSDLETIARRLEEEYPATNVKMGVGLTPLQEWIVGASRPALLLLLAAVALVLLIACANVVNLLLVRAGARAREMAVRAALGAARRRLVRQLLCENLMLSLVASLLGALAARWGIRAFVAWGPKDVPRLDEVVPDVRVMAIAVGVMILATAFFGLWPAFAGSRLDVTSSLGATGRALSSGRRHRRTRRFLVIGEVALALVLAAGAGLLIKSLYRLYRVDAGFDPEGVLAAQLRLPGAAYQGAPEVIAFLDELRERGQALPGVESASVARGFAFLTEPWTSDFAIEGRDREAFGIEIEHLEIGLDFLRTLKIPLVAGRAFSAADRPDAPPVVIVNEALANRQFPGEDPIGRRIAFDRYPTDESTWYEIVGVAGDVLADGLRAPARPLAYHALAQSPNRGVYLFLRTSGDPRSLAGEVRALVRSMDADMPLMSVTVLSEAVGDSVARERFVALLLSVFGLTALLLAAVGTYGVMAVSVHQRTREIGIRMAIGATSRDVMGLVVGEGMGLIGAGFVVGLAATLLLARYLESLLFTVSTSDPSILAAVTLVLLCAGLAAALLPARRASRIDPMRTLRCE